MKTIVTHVSPDLDAITSTWLLLRFHHGWEGAEISFVPAGQTLNGAPPDEDPDIAHVDTGLGQYDHHQLTERSSAGRQVLNMLIEKGQLRKTNIEPLERIVDIVTLYDNFGEIHLSDPAADIHSFSINEIIGGLRSSSQNNHETVERMLPILDGLLIAMKVKVSAEKELKNGVTLQTRWGKSLIIETSNDEVLKLGLKLGYTFVARKDPERGYIRIKTFPSKDFDLTPLHDAIVRRDPEARWYLHPTGNMLLNGNYQYDTNEASRLDMAAFLAIVRET
jgi:hypothetical protein